jgi:hypothetical protein
MRKRKSEGGCKSKLSVNDKFLLALEYWREYRTFFHCGQNYGVSESTAFKTWISE